MRVVANLDHHVWWGLELDGGALVESWEHPGRADLVDDALRAAGFDEAERAEPAPSELLATVHDRQYLEFLRTAWDRWQASGRTSPAALGFAFPPRRGSGRRPDTLDGQLGYHAFAVDCSITAATWPVATASAGAAARAAELVAGGEGAVFARCRPPGHHASRDQFGGYCYLNNAAVAAAVLRQSGASRVGVLDVDYHHGNGTQDIFYDRSDVVTCSIHADPRYQFPWFSGHVEERGEGGGEGHNHNFPLPAGTEAPAWMEALDEALDRVAALDALVVSLGVDTHCDDPISDFNLRTEDYPPIGAAIGALNLPTVVVLEGGYSPRDPGPEDNPALGRNVAAFLSGLAG